MSDMAFFDATCPKCGHSFGWHGLLVDRPACRCGHNLPREELIAAQAKMDEARRLMALSPHRASGAEKQAQRKLAGLTLGQAAKLLGVSLTELSAIERGEIECPARVSMAMGNAYECGERKDGDS